MQQHREALRCYNSTLNTLFMKIQILLFISLFCAKILSAQTTTVQDPLKSINIRNDGFKRFSLGLSTGIEQTAFRFDKLSLDSFAAQAKAASDKSITGFTLGISTRTRFTKNWDLLIDVGALFKDKSLSFNPADNGTSVGRFKINGYQIPIHLRYMIDKWKVKPNLYFGGEFTWRVNSNATDAGFNTSASYIDIGAGIQIKLWKITINPGLSYGFGLSNLLKPGASVLDNAANILKQNKFSMSLHIF